VIGLVGGIGAGKSRVAALLAECGANVIDADTVGHALLDQRPVRDLVVARFGRRVLERSESGSEPVRIDRRVLGPIVFADPAALRQLEAILHPRMRRTFDRAIARTIRRGRARALVLDAAVLFEAGWNTLCDTVVFVDAPRDQRLSRLAAARGWTAETLAARESAQWPLEKKRGLADAIVVNDNDATTEPLAREVRSLAAQLFPPARDVRRRSRSSGPAGTEETLSSVGTPDGTGSGIP
jgi:dephospho-CoA kinase